MTLDIGMTRVQRERETHGDSSNARGISDNAFDLGEGVWTCDNHPT